MKKILAIIFTFLIVSYPVLAEEIVLQEVQKVVTQEIENENTYLGANLLKVPSESNSKQLVTNHKSFLILNIIINGKIKEK